MLLLAFDTATPTVGAALHDGVRVIAVSAPARPVGAWSASGSPGARPARDDARRHGELLAPAIQQVLGQVGAVPTDLTDLAVGTGPGPFTGLRVGLVTARTLGQTLGIAVHGVCTLDALALQAVLDGALPVTDFVVATDARRREVYWAGYRWDASHQDEREAGVPERLSGPAVGPAADLPRVGRPTVGRGADLYPESLGPRLGPADPDAGAVATWAVRALVAGRDLSDLSPRYLRRPDVHEGAVRKSALG
jgi:tRNA threonylcarbamoyladenosine biosynthesis protein TsaB